MVRFFTFNVIVLFLTSIGGGGGGERGPRKIAYYHLIYILQSYMVRFFTFNVMVLFLTRIGGGGEGGPRKPRNRIH